MRTPALMFIASVACAFGMALHGQDTKRKETAAEKFERGKLGNVPVALHGRVVDQDNQPLSGVIVVLRLQVGYMRTPFEGHTRYDNIELTTSPEGIFNLTDKKAGSIDVVSVQKVGYEASGKNPYRFDFFLFGVPHHVPDPQNPVVFRMWKKRGAEPMLYTNLRLPLPADGTPTHFDLRRGALAQSGGHIRITFTRSPLNIQRGKQRYDWVAVIEVPEGGILKSDDEFKFLAPENGFQPSVVLKQHSGDPDWNTQKTFHFYLKTTEGYGRASVKLVTDFEPPPISCTIESWINPSGSRVLEYDPLKRVVSGRQKPK